MEIHLIRHTKPDIGKGICYGQSNIGVLDSFENEKSSFISKLNTDFDAVFSSPLERCLILSKAIKGDNLLIDNRLMEYNFGEWEGRPWAEIPQDELEPWMIDFVNIPAKGGENLNEMYERVSAFINDLLLKENKKVLIVAHSVVIRCFWAFALEIPLKNIFRIKVEFGDIWKFNLDANSNYNSFIGID
jgi:alpha-ribazole phosphatase